MIIPYDTNYRDWPFNWHCVFCKGSGDRTGQHFFKRKGGQIAHIECWSYPYHSHS